MRERSTRPGRKYAAIPNDAMRDTRLSMDARGLLALLMTYADDWQFSREHLMGVTGWGKDKFGKVMSELAGAGYVEIINNRNEQGHLLGRTWVIKDEATDVREMPTSDATDVRQNRRPVKPTSGKTAPIRKPILKKTNLEEITPTPSGQEDFFAESNEKVQPRPEPEDRFEEFWTAFPPGRKTDKRKARDLFMAITTGKHRKIPKTDAGTIITAASAFAATRPDPQFTPMPTTWLNGERWVSDTGPPSSPVKRASDFRPGEVYR